MNTEATIPSSKPQWTLRASINRNQEWAKEIDTAIGDIESALGMMPIAEAESESAPATRYCDATEINALIVLQDKLNTGLARFVERLRRIGASLKQMF